MVAKRVESLGDVKFHQMQTFTCSSSEDFHTCLRTSYCFETLCALPTSMLTCLIFRETGSKAGNKYTCKDLPKTRGKGNGSEVLKSRGSRALGYETELAFHPIIRDGFASLNDFIKEPDEFISRILSKKGFNCRIAYRIMSRCCVGPGMVQGLLYLFATNRFSSYGMLCSELINLLLQDW